MTVCCVNPCCNHYLARAVAYGRIEIVDGCHGSVEGVVKAAKLHERIFRDAGPWVMVTLEALPDGDVSIDEASAAVCASLVAGETGCTTDAVHD